MSTPVLVIAVLVVALVWRVDEWPRRAQVLAALAYAQNPKDMWFLNPQQWVTHHMFQDASIWDIPLVKPRFGCSANLALSLQGYDVAAELDKIIVSSAKGSCETGFLTLDASRMRPKPQVEFGKAAGGKSPPDIAVMKVSVMYTATAADAKMFQATFPTVVENFPGAKEVVILVPSISDRAVYQQIARSFEASAAFPISVVVPYQVSPTDVRNLFTLLWASDYCTGDFVLHLNANSVLLQPMTYDRVFHFRKPVLPYTRFVEYGERDALREGRSPCATG